jgi:hypothetical protein
MLGGISFGERLAQCTDKEKLDAQSDRTSARQVVLTERDAAKKIFTDADIDSKDYLPFFTDEIGWWDSHPSLCPIDIQTRRTQFTEKLQEQKTKLIDVLWAHLNTLPVPDAQTKVNKLPADLRPKIQDKLNSKIVADKEANPPPVKPSERTVWMDLSDAWKTVRGVLFGIAWALIGLRIASFAANDILHKPLAYRVLIFLYTFAGAPIFMWYYLYRWIKGLILNDPADTPRFEGLFPVSAYTLKEGETISLYNRFFGYQDTPQLQEWIASKQASERSGWLKALESTEKVIQQIVKAKEDAENLK